MLGDSQIGMKVVGLIVELRKELQYDNQFVAVPLY
jgi:hypothetical protein